ncbi:GGDEF domain-containing protein [Thauera chlorobenzoica]|nr:GGDEF domain-containing protein [Thauera chlorobenzoica]SEF71304.1 diguanylate cyclase (GGDEF) domain-containing protein [Thauera chlorobenzoica]
MKRFRSMPLGRRMVLVLLLPGLVFALVLGALFLHQSNRDLDRSTLARGQAIVSFLGPAAEYVLVSGNPVALEGLMARALEQADVAAVAFYDAGGALLGRAGRGAADLPATAWKAEGDGIVVVAHEGRLQFVSAVLGLAPEVEDYPSAVDGGRAERLGWVQIDLDTTARDAEKNRVLLSVSALVLLVLSAAVGMALRLARAVGGPVAALAQAVDRMAGGDLEVRVRVQSSSEELRALESGFNVMAGSIAEHQRTLQARIDEATAQLAHQARHDPLTGLPNRRAFEESIEHAASTYRRAGDVATLLYLDLDRFKPINDTCGHAAGDRLLCELAGVLRGRLRAGDQVFRIGGDEFAVILYGCDRESAHRIASALCEAVSSFGFVHSGRTFTVGASIGMARMEGENHDVSAVMQAADQACYEAKREGRGRVIEYQQP